MSAIPQALYCDVKAALQEAGRDDLVARLEQVAQKILTTGQAASLLGVASTNTVKNWLEAGHFPGAYRTPGGHWRFVLAEVEAVKARMEQLNQRNQRGDLEPLDMGDDDSAPPLL